MFSAQEFASALPYGGARSNLFKVLIPTGSILDVNSGGTSMSRFISLNAKTTSIPPSTIEPVEVPFGGRTFRLPGGRTFDDWGITVTNDEDYVVRDFFEQWCNSISSHSHGLRSTSGTDTIEDYRKDCTVEAYAKDGQLMRKYMMKGAWPHTISETALDWAENGSIQEFEVTFAFDYWDSSATSTSDGITVSGTDFGSTNPMSSFF